MNFSTNLQLCPNQASHAALHLVLATLGQTTYMRLNEARRSYTKNPASRIMVFNNNLQLCPNQVPYMQISNLFPATQLL